MLALFDFYLFGEVVFNETLSGYHEGFDHTIFDHLVTRDHRLKITSQGLLLGFGLDLLRLGLAWVRGEGLMVCKGAVDVVFGALLNVVLGQSFLGESDFIFLIIFDLHEYILILEQWRIVKRMDELLQFVLVFDIVPSPLEKLAQLHKK